MNRKPRYTNFQISNPLALNQFKSMTLCLAISLISTASYASVSQPGFYAGLGVASISAEEAGASSNELGFSLIGGYAISDMLSTEVSLFNLGDHNNLGMKGNGISISAIGHYAISDKTRLFGEFGGMTVDLAVDEVKNQSLNSEEILEDGNDSSLYFAFGAKYAIDNWSFSVKFSSVDLDADLNIFSTQAHYYF